MFQASPFPATLSRSSWGILRCPKPDGIHYPFSNFCFDLGASSQLGITGRPLKGGLPKTTLSNAYTSSSGSSQNRSCSTWTSHLFSVVEPRPKIKGSKRPNVQHFAFNKNCHAQDFFGSRCLVWGQTWKRLRGEIWPRAPSWAQSTWQYVSSGVYAEVPVFTSAHMLVFSG